MNMAVAQQFINCFCEGYSELIRVTGNLPSEEIEEQHYMIVNPQPDGIFVSVYTRLITPCFRLATEEETEQITEIVKRVHGEQSVANPNFN